MSLSHHTDGILLLKILNKISRSINVMLVSVWVGSPKDNQTDSLDREDNSEKKTKKKQ